MELPEPQISLCAILLMKSQPQKILCPCKSMAQGGYSRIASCLLSLRPLFWHRASHEQLQKSRDGPALASWRDECGSKCQEKEIASRVLVLATCLWERVGRWLLFLPWRMGVAFFILSAKCLPKQNCHKIFSHMIIDLSPSSGLVFMSHHSFCYFWRFSPETELRNHFCSSCEEAKTVPHMPGHWGMAITPGPDHALCALCT